MTVQPDPARARFLILTALRWSGAIMALMGVTIIAGVVRLPPEAGYVLMILGVIETLVLPPVLARKWRTPPA